MQISANTTNMEAGITVATDKEGRNFCVVVIKGTFQVNRHGIVGLADEQAPFVYADEHYGDPGETSIKYECDFAPFKPRADVLLNGQAFAPKSRPVEEIVVSLRVDSFKKRIRVVGDRHWESILFKLTPSQAAPFETMPLRYERAFGGSDHSHDNPKRQGSEMRNPVGVSFWKIRDASVIEGTPLPNLEALDGFVRKISDAPEPAGFGGLGRNWSPRVGFAGTYDDAWLNDRFPFLPEDFNERYFQSAPIDQQLEHLRGGETVRCTNMNEHGEFKFTVPEVEVPVLFRFRDEDVKATPKLDTLIVEPDQSRFILTWRTRVPLGRKLNALQEVLVGKQPSKPAPASRNGKRYFGSLAEFIAWKRSQK